MLTQQGNIFLVVEIFYKFAEKVQCLLTGVCAGKCLCQLNIISDGVNQLAGLVIADANNIQCVVVVPVLYEFIKFAIVLKSSIHALKFL